MTPTKPSLKTTGDGSHTLYSDRFDQLYHNPNGAIAENKHVFFEQNGLMEALREKEEIHILEIGFGTGLNLLLLMDACRSMKSPAKINYHTIEAYPISRETSATLNYENYLNRPEITKELTGIFGYLKPGINSFSLNPAINLAVFFGLFEDYHPEKLRFDFIFHDAFSPRVNPELWTGDVFRKLIQWSNREGVLTTYCAASKARGAMAWAGWKVARAGGALDKREMTVASPSEEPLAHLKRINEERLGKRYNEGDF